MRRVALGLVAAGLAISVPACSGEKQFRGGGGGSKRVHVVVLAPTNSGCKYIAADQLAFAQDDVHWYVYNFCAAQPAGTKVRIDFGSKSNSPKQGTQFVEGDVNDLVAAGNVKYTDLQIAVDAQPTGGDTGSGCSPKNGAHCYKYDVYLAGKKLQGDPRLEIDP